MDSSQAVAPLVDFTGKEIKLTRKENEVLLLIGEGMSSKEVADQLFVSKRTIDFHLSNVYGKLQVTNRMKAYRRAQSLGLLTA